MKIIILFLFFTLLNFNNSFAAENNYKKSYKKWKKCYTDNYIKFPRDPINKNMSGVELEKFCVHIIENLLSDFKQEDIKKNIKLYSEATYDYAKILKRIGNIEKAINVYKDIFELKYLDQNNKYKIYAASNLGWILNSEIGFVNYKEAFEYTKYAADQNNSRAINNLGVFYLQGRVVKKNFKKSYKLFKKAALIGDRYAFYNLAIFHLIGIGGIDKDLDKGIRYLKLSKISRKNLQTMILLHENYSLLDIIFLKNKAPETLNEIVKWYEEKILNDHNYEEFNDIAWILYYSKKPKYTEIYKWHYLTFMHSKNYKKKSEAENEMKALENLYLNDKEIKSAKKMAVSWSK